MKVLVTGSSGMLGTRILPVLRQHTEVVEYDLTTGVDIFNGTQLRSCLEGCDAVLHLAAHAHRNAAPEWEDFERLNINGTKAVFAAACAVGVSRFVYMSTGNVYCLEDRFRSTAKPPFHTDDVPLIEEVVAHYPKSKLIAEACLRAQALEEIEVLVLRPNWIESDGGGGYHGATVSWETLTQGAAAACVIPKLPGKYTILDLIEPNDNFPSSHEAAKLLKLP